MNCKSAELYMNALLDNELSVKDSMEILDHIENCKDCKSKWELNEETRSRLKHFFSFIKASDSLKNKVSKELNLNKRTLYQKPLLIAASIAFLLGFGMSFSQGIVFKSPTLAELQNSNKFQIASNDINTLSNHINYSLNKKQFIKFEEANFKFLGATKLINIVEKKRVTLIALKNNLGDKVSLCFLPEGYKLPECHNVEKNGMTFHCGKDKNCNFAYWYLNGTTVALLSKTLTPEEMIDLALPLAESYKA